LHVFNTGKVTLPDRLVYRDGSLLAPHSLDVLAFVIEHPRQGLILVGTGLNRKIADEPERYLGALGGTLSAVEMAKDQNFPAQLKRAKLPEKRVRSVILPDLRFTHTGEIQSFPAAQRIATSAEHQAATEQGEEYLYLAKEYDHLRDWRFIDFAGAEPVGTFRAHRDLFGDGSVLLIDAAGATAGGLAVLVRLPTRPILLCGNLAWTKQQYFYVRPPGLVFNREAWWEKAWRLKKFKDLVEELAVLPDHDWTAVEIAKTKDMVLHTFSAKEETTDSHKEKRENKAKKESKDKKQQGHATQKKKAALTFFFT
jgi:glyoxylase-like metal-dependent hydrolase (beta-lactamase superfamily II)